MSSYADIISGYQRRIAELEQAVTDANDRALSAERQRDQALSRVQELELENDGLRSDVRTAQNIGYENGRISGMCQRR